MALSFGTTGSLSPTQLAGFIQHAKSLLGLPPLQSRGLMPLRSAWSSPIPKESGPTEPPHMRLRYYLEGCRPSKTLTQHLSPAAIGLSRLGALLQVERIQPQLKDGVPLTRIRRLGPVYAMHELASLNCSLE
jgi:hypothetical protein